MYIDDDANTETVVLATTKAIRESARHIGKADRTVSPQQIGEVEAAIKELQNALNNQRRANNA